MTMSPDLTIIKKNQDAVKLKSYDNNVQCPQYATMIYNVVVVNDIKLILPLYCLTWSMW